MSLINSTSTIRFDPDPILVCEIGNSVKFTLAVIEQMPCKY